MKKLNVLALTGAMVAAMSMTAFADGLMSKTGNAESATKYTVDFSGLTEEQVASITKITADVTLDSDYVNGAIGGNVDGAWAAPQVELSGSGQFVWEPAGSLVAKDDAGNLAPYAEVQFWWVNNINGDESTPGTATLTAVTFYDKDGNVVSAGAGEATADVAPVAYLAAIVAIAGVAMVASKKRA